MGKPIPRVRRGDVVWGHFKDSSGRYTAHPHAAVVITTNDEIDAGLPVFLVAVSSKRYWSDDPGHLVALPWKPEGDPDTGFFKPCHAVCYWVVILEEINQPSIRGKIPGKYLKRIDQCLNKLDGGG